MIRTRSYDQQREPDPDYSNEEERAALAERILEIVPEIRSMEARDGIVEACYRVGFNGMDCHTLRLIARRLGQFPVCVETLDVTDGRPRTVRVHLDAAAGALRSPPDENIDFWDDPVLVEEAKRRAPREWSKVEARLEREARRIRRAFEPSRP